MERDLEKHELVRLTIRWETSRRLARYRAHGFFLATRRHWDALTKHARSINYKNGRERNGLRKTKLFSCWGLASTRKYTKIFMRRNLILSSLLTLLKILKFELFKTFSLNNSSRLLKYKVWNIFAFYPNLNIQNFLLITEFICWTPHLKFLVSNFQ